MKLLKMCSMSFLFVLVAQNVWASDPITNFLTRFGTFLRQVSVPAGIIAIIAGVFSVWLAIEQRTYTIAFKICVGVAIIGCAPSLVQFFYQLAV